MQGRKILKQGKLEQHSPLNCATRVCEANHEQTVLQSAKTASAIIQHLQQLCLFSDPE